MASKGSKACVLPALPIKALGHETNEPAGNEARNMKCRPHRWNIEDWLPLYGKPVEKSYPEIWCLDCGRVLAVRDMTLNMRASIANGIAKRVFDGDEYDEVYESVNEYFTYHLAAFRKEARSIAPA